MKQKRIRKLLMSMGVERNLVNGFIRETIETWRRQDEIFILSYNSETDQLKPFYAPSWEEQYRSLLEAARA